MKTHDRLDRPDSFEDRLRAGLHRLAHADPVADPGALELDLVRLTPEDSQPQRRRATALAAAALTAITVGGLVALAFRGTVPSSSGLSGPATTAPSRSTSPPSTTTPAGESAPTTETPLIPPEMVTFSNYRAGVLAFADCVAAAGHPLLQLYQRVDEPLLFNYEVTDAGDATTCYDDHLAVIDELWQYKIERERYTDPEPDADFEHYLACSTRLGRPTETQQSLRDILGDLARNSIDLASCDDSAPKSG